jgi:hypothetical protein
LKIPKSPAAEGSRVDEDDEEMELEDAKENRRTVVAPGFVFPAKAASAREEGNAVSGSDSSPKDKITDEELRDASREKS